MTFHTSSFSFLFWVSAGSAACPAEDWQPMFTKCVMAMRAARGHPRSSRRLLAPGRLAFLTPQGGGGGHGAGSGPWVCVQSVRGIEWPVWVLPGLGFPSAPGFASPGFRGDQSRGPAVDAQWTRRQHPNRSVFDVLDRVQNLQLKQPTLHPEQYFEVGLPSSWATDVETGAQGE